MVAKHWNNKVDVGTRPSTHPDPHKQWRKEHRLSLVDIPVSLTLDKCRTLPANPLQKKNQNQNPDFILNPTNII